MPKADPTTHEEFAEGAVTLVLGTIALLQPNSVEEMKRVEKLAVTLISAHLREYIERTITSAVAAADAKLGEL